jgi:hypothetical protein
VIAVGEEGGTETKEDGRKSLGLFQYISSRQCNLAPNPNPSLFVRIRILPLSSKKYEKP